LNDPSPTERRAAAALLGLGMVAWTVAETVFARAKALGLQSEWAFDVTFFHNLVWNTVNGNGWTQSATYHEPPGIFGETHFEPILLLAAPLYAVMPSLTTLLTVQTAVLSLGAIGVYRLLVAEGMRPLGAALGGWVFLLWWPLIRMGQADVRPLLWALPFLLLTVAALREARHWQAFTWGLLACLCREEVPVMVAGAAFGALLWLKAPARARRITAVTLAVAAGVFFVVTTLLRSNTTFYIQPERFLDKLMGTGEDQPSSWGQTPAELLPVRLRYLREWVVPAGLGIALAPEALIGSIPLWVYLFAEAHEWAGWEGPYVHHAAPAAGLFAAAAALGWGRLIRWSRIGRWLGPVVLIGLFAAEAQTLQDRWERVMQPEWEPWAQQHDRVVEAHRLAALVPADASVMADWDTVHLFSGRAQVWSYHQESPEPLTVPAPGEPLNEPLLVPAGLTPAWALVKRDDHDWTARTEAAGLVERDRGSEWALFGPPD